MSPTTTSHVQFFQAHLWRRPIPNSNCNFYDLEFLLPNTHRSIVNPREPDSLHTIDPRAFQNYSLVQRRLHCISTYPPYRVYVEHARNQGNVRKGLILSLHGRKILRRNFQEKDYLYLDYWAILRDVLSISLVKASHSFLLCVEVESVLS